MRAFRSQTTFSCKPETHTSTDFLISIWPEVMTRILSTSVSSQQSSSNNQTPSTSHNQKKNRTERVVNFAVTLCRLKILFEWSVGAPDNSTPCTTTQPAVNGERAGLHHQPTHTHTKKGCAFGMWKLARNYTTHARVCVCLCVFTARKNFYPDDDAFVLVLRDAGARCRSSELRAPSPGVSNTVNLVN